MKKVTILLLTVAIAGFLSCKSTKKTTAGSTDIAEKQVEQTEPKMLATINRTACYGQCPMYKATFMDNGEVFYVGRRFVENIGTYKTLITTEEVNEIKNQIVAANYFELDSLYPTLVTDFPSCITEAQLNGQSKRIINRRNPPTELRNFEKFLDSLLEARDWGKVSESTDYQNP